MSGLRPSGAHTRVHTNTCTHTHTHTCTRTQKLRQAAAAAAAPGRSAASILTCSSSTCHLPTVSPAHLEHGRQSCPAGNHSDALLDVGLVRVLWDGTLHLQQEHGAGNTCARRASLMHQKGWCGQGARRQALSKIPDCQASQISLTALSKIPDCQALHAQPTAPVPNGAAAQQLTRVLLAAPIEDRVPTAILLPHIERMHRQSHGCSARLMHRGPIQTRFFFLAGLDGRAEHGQGSWAKKSGLTCATDLQGVAHIQVPDELTHLASGVHLCRQAHMRAGTRTSGAAQAWANSTGSEHVQE